MKEKHSRKNICPRCSNLYTDVGLLHHSVSCKKLYDLKDVLIDAYTAGVSAKKLESKYGIGTRALHSLLKSMGIHRNMSEARKLSAELNPRKLTECHKKKISESRIEYLKNNPDKVPYLLNHSSKESYPEKRFRRILNDIGIVGWIPNYQHSIYEYDFAFPEIKLDVEIDGGTHLSDKVKAIDSRRDIFSKSEGWTIIRFTASRVSTNASECISELIAVIYSLDSNYPLYNKERWDVLKDKLKRKMNKYFCDCGKQIEKRSKRCMKCHSKWRSEQYSQGNMVLKGSNRPSLETLISDIKSSSYLATGRKYGVSDNAIRKWVIDYGEDPKKIKIHRGEA